MAMMPTGRDTALLLITRNRDPPKYNPYWEATMKVYCEHQCHRSHKTEAQERGHPHDSEAHNFLILKIGSFVGGRGVLYV